MAIKKFGFNDKHLLNFENNLNQLYVFFFTLHFFLVERVTQAVNKVYQKHTVHSHLITLKVKYIY